MAGADTRSAEQVQREIQLERERLATAVEQLRAGIGEATNVTAKLRSNLPVVAVGALAAGFVVTGGIGATMRLLMRRSREGQTTAQVGRFRLVQRR